MISSVSISEIVRVGIADKNPLVRAGLKHLLLEDPRFEPVFGCASGEEFIEAATRRPIDVGVCGWVMMPGEGNGKYVLDQLAGHDGAPRIIIYTGEEGEALAAQVMAHGGAAYVYKSEPMPRFLDTIAAVAAGQMVFPYLDVRRIHYNPLTGLTRRELEVLSALANGRANKQIAREQEVSLNTVKFHIKNLYSKLSVHNRAQAVALYLKS